MDDPEASKNVYFHLKNWMTRPSDHRMKTYEKQVAASNDVRQLLFSRNIKAYTKYGQELKLEHPRPAFNRAAEKIADAVFFLYQAYHNGETPVNGLHLIQNLHTLLGNLLFDYCKKFDFSDPTLNKDSRH